MLQLIDFYLRPAFPKRNVELLKLKLMHQIDKIDDPLLKEVTLIREGLKLVTKKRKAVLHALHESRTLSHIHPLFDLSPQDFLILISAKDFPLKSEALSLALQMPVDSIHFRRHQLESQLAEDGLESQSLTELAYLDVSPALIKKRTSLKSLFQSFQTMPLAFRFAVETAAILVSLLAVLWIIPEIRNHYENSIQRRINDYLIESSLVDAPAPEGTSKTPKTIISAPSDTASDDEDTAIDKSSSKDAATRKQPKVNEGETWRFSLTGSSTPEIESAVEDSISKMGISTQKPLTVPGGIQFDFVLPVDHVIPIKTALEEKVSEIQQKASSSKMNLMSVANLSWYKKKNMGTRKIPSAHVQVIIWISTL